MKAFYIRLFNTFWFNLWCLWI